jgi:DNA-binding beta-propeller fold protein YncE
MGKIRRMFVLLVVAVLWAIPGHGQIFEPLTLVQKIELPDVPRGAFTDHLCIDIKGHRLFTTMQAQKVVAVIDLQTGKVVQNIPIGNPHACEYREDLEQLYVSDGDLAKPGLKIYSGRDYHLLKAVGLAKGTDSMGYDPRSKYLYLVNGGERADMEHSLISIVDTSTGEHVGDIEAASKFLEDMDIDTSGSRLYITDEDANNLVVVDRQKRTTVATWPITKGGTVVAAIVDGAHHRLFVACRTTDLNGSIVVIDTETGKELKALPIGGWLDYMAFDAQTGRLYAVCGVGYVYVYQQLSPDDYVLLGKAETGLLGKTGLLVPELHEFFVALPMLGWDPARVLIFRVN